MNRLGASLERGEPLLNIHSCTEILEQKRQHPVNEEGQLDLQLQ